MSRRSLLTSAAFLALSARVKACEWGRPVWHPEPVLEPTEPWEGTKTHTPTAMPFSDGCWWDADRQCFCLWYMAGYTAGTGFAQSTDGYTWRKLGLIDARARDSSTVWPDGRGYVRATWFLHAPGALTLERSDDGITWRTVGRSPACGDRSTLFRTVTGDWMLSLRVSGAAPATTGRQFWRAEAFEGPYTRVGPELWAQPDDDWQALGPPAPQLYNLDARAFGAGYLGLMSIWGGDRYTAPKRNTLRVCTSLDGLTWTRGPAQWIDEQPGAQNVQTCGGLFIALPDGKLGILVSTRSGPVGPVNRQRCVTRLLTIAPREVCV